MKVVSVLDNNNSFEETCNILLTSLFPSCSDYTRPASHSPTNKDLRLQYRTVTEEEIEHAITFANHQSAPEHNGITNKALTTAHTAQPQLLRHIFNTSFEQGHFLKDRKDATCIVIPKPNMTLILVPNIATLNLR